MDWKIDLTLIALATILAYFSKKIDAQGAIVGFLIAFAMWLGGGLPILSLLLVFFVLGSGASSWKKKQKQQQGLAEKNQGKRSVIHAFSNAGVAGVCGILAYFFTEHQFLLLSTMAASLASATSDTLSSELGNIYGSRYFNIITFQKGQRGLDGIISLEGTLIGLYGSIIIALLFGFIVGFGNTIIWVATAGFVGNLSDSILGATLQHRGLLSNHTVNLASTIIAAIVLVILFLVFGV